MQQDGDVPASEQAAAHPGTPSISAQQGMIKTGTLKGMRGPVETEMTEVVPSEIPLVRP